MGHPVEPVMLERPERAARKLEPVAIAAADAVAGGKAWWLLKLLPCEEGGSSFKLVHCHRNPVTVIP